MTNPRALSADNARLAALEDSERKIHSAFRRGLEATCSIAKELDKIHSQKLYEERVPDFREYVTDFLLIDPRSYDRIILVSHTIALLQEAGLALPQNETQAAELGRLEDPQRRANVWAQLVETTYNSDRPLTAELVRRAVEAAKSVPAPAAPRKRGIEVSMDEGDNGDEQPAEKPVKGPVVSLGPVLTEKGEAALARIGKICGQSIADDIESGAAPLTEKELRAWAELEPDLMRAITGYVIDERWTVAKAVAFESKPLDRSTSAGTMITMAQARGGTAILSIEGIARITVTLET